MSASHARERGQASVELVAVLPFLILLAAICWQFALTGHALWMSAQAARVAARADAVGRDPAVGARSALPNYLEHGLLVKRKGKAVQVSVRVPVLLPRWGGPLRVSATAALGGGA